MSWPLSPFEELAKRRLSHEGLHMRRVPDGLELRIGAVRTIYGATTLRVLGRLFLQWADDIEDDTAESGLP